MNSSINRTASLHASNVDRYNLDPKWRDEKNERKKEREKEKERTRERKKERKKERKREEEIRK